MRLPVLLAPLLLLAPPLAGCSAPIQTVHKVGVWNSTDAPVDVRVVVRDNETAEVALEREFRVVPGHGEWVEERLRNGHDYVVEARWGNLTVEEVVQVHSGSWSITVYADEGSLRVATLHGD